MYTEGIPAWRRAKNIFTSTVRNLKENIDKDIPHVLIDLRPSAELKDGFIAGAVSIPLEEIVKAGNKFPADKKAPIILYSSEAKPAAGAFKTVRDWGYANTSILVGGIEAWKKAGNPLASGEPKTTIVYVPKLRPGEIPSEEFKKIADTLPTDKFILDVRDTFESADGMIKGAKNIPVQHISVRLTEIPKDKEIIIHCSVGARSEMAYHQLREAGYKVRFLNAEIEIDKHGKYTILTE